MSGGFAVRVGDLLADRYRLDRRLGAGGMGEVWAGHDQALDRAVAVKVLLDAATNEELIARFRREATIGARLQHPGITVVHDVGQHEGRLFIVMELLSGEDLGAVLARERGGLPPAVAVDLAAQTAEALAAAHERAVVHRDLKPGNLFLLRSGSVFSVEGPDGAPVGGPVGGRLKICDFGIAHSADATAGWTVTGRMFGTPPYMAPEQWRGEHVDARCDLYALGCVLYALLSGEPPFGSAEPMYVLMRRHVEDVPLSLREAGAVVSPELDRLVLALLAKAPADRPESAAWVAKALRGLATSEAEADRGATDGAGVAGGGLVIGGAGVTGETWVDPEATGIPAEHDAGPRNAGAGDAGTGDAGTGDAGLRKVGSHEPGARDAGSRDADAQDPGTGDAGSRKAGSHEPGARDAGSRDAGGQDPDAQYPGSQDPGAGHAAAREAGSQDLGSRNAGGPNPGSPAPACGARDRGTPPGRGGRRTPATGWGRGRSGGFRRPCGTSCGACCWRRSSR
ncbi:serine/threonine protein kinase [Streptomyces sp. RerS4]|uniref:serine/threonine protein kinase n=1 Tax=Streptomyces sp. RerS4 TaxID=2942449 RepID=UPI00201CACFA|nr:serine/threonine protein kinase [Streptomyces sp. RerS4]UQX02811.1 protein kinase [Streptomyces sp. RerS4]